MRIAYLIFIGYALAGVVYTPSVESAVALVFIAASCVPLLLARASYEDQGVRIGVPRPWVYWGIVVLGVLNLAIIARSLDRSFWQLFSIEGLAAVAISSTERRYGAAAIDERSGNPILLALSLWLVFRAGCSVDRMSKLRQLIAVLPIIAYTLATTEKWPTYLAVVFFFAGILSAHPRKRAVQLAIRYLIVVGPVITLIGWGAMVLRGSRAGASYIANTLVHYVLSPYPAFGGWLIDRATSACCSLGGRSFVGPLDAAGLTVREPGVFSDIVVVHGRETNLYTSFRYLVEDFSLIGPLLIASLLTVVHVGLTMIGFHALARLVATFTIFAALMSINVTPFVHNSVALAMSLGMVSLIGVTLRRRHLPSAQQPAPPLGPVVAE